VLALPRSYECFCFHVAHVVAMGLWNFGFGRIAKLQSWPVLKFIVS
jgi:hypothetical protein